MKIAFVVYSATEGGPTHNRVMELLASLGIDYYTRWEHVKGKGHGTDAHLGAPSFPAVNSMLLIAFQEEAPLEKLIVEIASLNAGATRPDARIRLFQVPLDRIV
jgi:hypothetical protein